MSTQDDIKFLSQAVVALSREVDELRNGEKKDTRTEKQITDDADKEARRVAHEARQAKYREDNSREGVRKRTAPPAGRRDDPVVPAARTTSLIIPQGMKPPRKAEPQQLQPIIPQTYNHPWKVGRSATGLNNPVPYAVSVIGGDVRTQNSFASPITVADNNSLPAPETGFVYLQITRDPDSRAASAAVLDYATTVPSSDYTDQYVPLAYVTVSGDGSITNIQQLWFSEMDVFELMVVSNGEFVLMQTPMAGRNPYDLPPP